MDYRNVRAAMKQGQLGRFGTGFLAADAIAAAILVGIPLDSWLAGIVTFAVGVGSAGWLARALPMHWITAITGLMSLIWTAAAALVATRLGGGPLVVTVSALVVGSLGYCAHLAGFLTLRDVEYDNG